MRAWVHYVFHIITHVEHNSEAWRVDCGSGLRRVMKTRAAAEDVMFDVNLGQTKRDWTSAFPGEQGQKSGQFLHFLELRNFAL